MTTTDENRGRTLGAYAAYSEVLNYINTLEDRTVAKKDIYAAVMAMRPPEVAALTTPRYITEWSEEDGQVLWWHYPIEEAPYVGSPLDIDFDDNWHTWWTPLPDVQQVVFAFEQRRSPVSPSTLDKA